MRQQPIFLPRTLGVALLLCIFHIPAVMAAFRANTPILQGRRRTTVPRIIVQQQRPAFPLPTYTTTTTTPTTTLRSASNDNNNSGNNQRAQDDFCVGDTVVLGNSIPNLSLWQFQSYKIVSIYDQGSISSSGAVDDGDAASSQDGSVVQKIARTSLSQPVDPPTFTRYLALYSEKHHGQKELGQAGLNHNGQPVIVLPEEVDLSSMKDEIIDSVIMALPLFAFWTALAFRFASQYSERTGGTASFVDAMLGR